MIHELNLNSLLVLKNKISMKILVTGTAGFIGFHLAKRLLERGDTVVGIDNINDYYDVNLKYARLAETGISREAENWHTKVQSTKYPNYSFVRMNLENREELNRLTISSYGKFLIFAPFKTKNQV